MNTKKTYKELDKAENCCNEVMGLLSELSSDQTNENKEEALEDVTRRPSNNVGATKQQEQHQKNKAVPQQQPMKERIQASHRKLKGQQASQGQKSLHQLVEMQKQYKQSLKHLHQNNQALQQAALEGESGSTDAQLYAPSTQAVMHQMIKDQNNKQAAAAQKAFIKANQSQPSQVRVSHTKSRERNKSGQGYVSSGSNNQMSQQPKRDIKVQQQPLQRTSAVVKAQMIPSYTSQNAKMRCEKGKHLFPNDPNKYRKVNIAMDKELVWYRTEIEKRFQKSELKSYKLAENVKPSYIQMLRSEAKKANAIKNGSNARTLKKQVSQPHIIPAPRMELSNALSALVNNDDYGQHSQEIIQFESSSMMNGQQENQQSPSTNLPPGSSQAAMQNMEDLTKNSTEQKNTLSLDEQQSYTLDLNNSRQESQYVFDMSNSAADSIRKRQQPERGESKLIAITEEKQRDKLLSSQQQPEDINESHQSMNQEEGQAIYKSTKELKSPFNVNVGNQARPRYDQQHNTVPQSMMRTNEGNYHVLSTDGQSSNTSSGIHTQKESTRQAATASVVPQLLPKKPTNKKQHQISMLQSYLDTNKVNQQRMLIQSKQKTLLQHQHSHSLNQLSSNHLPAHHSQTRQSGNQSSTAVGLSSGAVTSTRKKNSKYRHKMTTSFSKVELRNNNASMNKPYSMFENAEIAAERNHHMAAVNQQNLANQILNGCSNDYGGNSRLIKTGSGGLASHHQHAGNTSSHSQFSHQQPSPQMRLGAGAGLQQQSHTTSSAMLTTPQQPEYAQMFLPATKQRKANSKQSRKKQLMAMVHLNTGDDQMMLAYNGQDKQTYSVQNQKQQQNYNSASSANKTASSLSTRNQRVQQHQPSSRPQRQESVHSRSTSNKRRQMKKQMSSQRQGGGHLASNRSLSNGRARSSQCSNSRSQARSVNKSRPSPPSRGVGGANNPGLAGDQSTMLPFSFYQDTCDEPLQFHFTGNTAEENVLNTESTTSARKNKVLSLSEARSMGLILPNQNPGVNRNQMHNRVHTGGNIIANSLNSLITANSLKGAGNKQQQTILTKAQHARHRTTGLAKQYNSSTVHSTNQRTIEPSQPQQPASNRSAGGGYKNTARHRNATGSSDSRQQQDNVLLYRAQNHMTQMNSQASQSNSKRQRADMARSQEAISLLKGTPRAAPAPAPTFSQATAQHQQMVMKSEATALGAHESSVEAMEQQNQRRFITEEQEEYQKSSQPTNTRRKSSGKSSIRQTRLQQHRQHTQRHNKKQQKYVKRSNMLMNNSQQTLTSFEQAMRSQGVPAEAQQFVNPNVPAGSFAMPGLGNQPQQDRHQHQLSMQTSQIEQSNLIGGHGNSSNLIQQNQLRSNSSINGQTASAAATNEEEQPSPQMPHLVESENEYLTSQSNLPSTAAQQHAQLNPPSANAQSQKKRSRQQTLNISISSGSAQYQRGVISSQNAGASKPPAQTVRQHQNSQMSQISSKSKRKEPRQSSRDSSKQPAKQLNIDNQSLIDLEAIKKSINKRIGQNTVDMKYHQEALAALQAQKDAQKGHKSLSKDSSFIIAQQHLSQNKQPHELPLRNIMASKSQYGAAVDLQPQQPQHQKSTLTKSSSQLSFRRLQEHYKDSQLLAKKSGSKKHRNSNHASLILSQHPAQLLQAQCATKGRHLKQQQLLSRNNHHEGGLGAGGGREGQGGGHALTSAARRTGETSMASNSKTFSLFDAYQAPSQNPQNSNNSGLQPSRTLAQLSHQQAAMQGHGHQKTGTYGLAASRSKLVHQSSGKLHQRKAGGSAALAKLSPSVTHHYRSTASFSQYPGQQQSQAKPSMTAGAHLDGNINAQHYGTGSAGVGSQIQNVAQSSHQFYSTRS